MDEKNLTPYAIEAAIASLERTIKRLWILCILLAVFLVASNAAWIYYESQWVDEITITQENTDGYNNYIGNDGDIINGATND